MYTGEGGYHEHLIVIRQEYNLRGTTEASDENSNPVLQFYLCTSVYLRQVQHCTVSGVPTIYIAIS